MASAGERSRYQTLLKLASGGMATVWIGQVRGALGFRQLVAIKKPHPHLFDDPTFRTELVAEARLASLIHHANVVDVRDVEIDGSSISLVMDYIEGATLGDLLVATNRSGARLSPAVAIRIVLDACAGLHAAHELVDERGRPVGLIHRDVSPQNLLVGADGISRVADFGVAKFARKNLQSTSEGSLKGKLAYMPPEYLKGETIDRRFDVFAIGVVLWEALVGKRCFRGDNEADTLHRILTMEPERPSRLVPELPTDFDEIVMTALAKARGERFENAAAMAAALEGCALGARLLAGHTEVARTIKALVGPAIEERRSLVRAKLANEPSVASLLDVPPIVPARASAPAGAPTVAPATTTAAPMATAATLMAAPTVTAAATPRMGGAGSPLEVAATMQVHVATEKSAFAASPSDPPPAAQPWVAHPFAATQVVTGPPPPSAPPTFGGPAAPINAPYTLRSERADTELSFHEPSAPVAVPLHGPRLRWWIAPTIVGVAGISILGGLVAARLHSSRSAPGAMATASAQADVRPVPESVPNARSSPEMTPPVPAASATAGGSTAPSPSKRTPPRTTSGRTAAPSATDLPPAVPAVPPSEPTSRKPPPNPYATPGEGR